MRLKKTLKQDVSKAGSAHVRRDVSKQIYKFILSSLHDDVNQTRSRRPQNISVLQRFPEQLKSLENNRKITLTGFMQLVRLDLSVYCTLQKTPQSSFKQN